MKRISFRDGRKAYPGQGEASTYPSAFPANPFNPNAGKPQDYSGITSGLDEAPKCPECKTQLLIDDKKDIGTCPQCNSRFSKVQYDAAYSKRATNPGLYSMDGGSNVDMDGGANYHSADPSPYDSSGSWTGQNGNQHYNN